MFDRLIAFLELDFSLRFFMFDLYYHNYYLPRHTTKGVKISHFVGVGTTIAWLLVGLFLLSGWALVACLVTAPLVVYPFAWSGHFLFGEVGNRMPAALTSNPLYAKLADLRMCYELLTGKLSWG